MDGHTYNRELKYVQVKHSSGWTSLVVQWLKFTPPVQGAWVRSLVRKLDPTCLNKEFACRNKDLTCHN